MKNFFKSNDLPGGRIRTHFPVYFIRHGQTDWNKARRFQGHSDIPLNDIGRAQAARNGQSLRSDISDVTQFSFYVSPLVRARETLEIIRTALRLSPRRFMIDDRLIEIDLGKWNGKTPDEINEEDPGVFERREENKWSFEVPGGESYANAAHRTREFLEDLKGPSIIVGHGASGRLLRGYLSSWKRDDIAHLEARQDIVYKLDKSKETTL